MDLNGVSSPAQAPPGEVRDWITAPIDYCSHHCPSERPEQEMHPPPLWAPGRNSSPILSLQSGRPTVSHGSHFVNGATITHQGCAFSGGLFDQWARLSRKSSHNVVYLKSSTYVSCVGRELLALMCPETCCCQLFLCIPETIKLVDRKQSTPRSLHAVVLTVCWWR